MWKKYSGRVEKVIAVLYNVWTYDSPARPLGASSVVGINVVYIVSHDMSMVGVVPSVASQNSMYGAKAESNALRSLEVVLKRSTQEEHALK